MRVVKALLAASILVALPVLLSTQDGDLTDRPPALPDAAVDVGARVRHLVLCVNRSHFLNGRMFRFVTLTGR